MPRDIVEQVLAGRGNVEWASSKSLYLPGNVPTCLPIATYPYLPWQATCLPTYTTYHTGPNLPTQLLISYPTYRPGYLVHTYLPGYLPSWLARHAYLLPTYPPTYLPTYLCTYLLTYLCLPIPIPTYLPLPTYLYLPLPTYLPPYLPTYLLTYPSTTCLHKYLPIYLPLEPTCLHLAT